MNPSCWNLPNYYFETVLLNDFSPGAIVYFDSTVRPFVSLNAFPTLASLIMGAVLFVVT